MRMHVYHDNNSSAKGLGFTGALQIAFIVLKLCKVIDWSWWWVLAPTWITLGIAGFCILFALWLLRD